VDSRVAERYLKYLKHYKRVHYRDRRIRHRSPKDNTLRMMQWEWEVYRALKAGMLHRFKLSERFDWSESLIYKFFQEEQVEGV